MSVGGYIGEWGIPPYWVGNGWSHDTALLARGGGHTLISVRVSVSFSFSVKEHTNTGTDIENITKITRAGFLISKFYPKVREICQFQNHYKTA